MSKLIDCFGEGLFSKYLIVLNKLVGFLLDILCIVFERRSNNRFLYDRVAEINASSFCVIIIY